jgi:endonuclease G, mitochondrial
MRSCPPSWLLAVALAVLPVSAGDAFKYGQPACAGPVLDKKYFVVCYDPDHKIPKWVGYALTRDDLATAVADRREGKFQFRADAAVLAGQRARTTDYTKSGYDKGHMAPAADFKRSVEAMRATFILTNAVPQKHGVNAGQWSQLEAAVRELAEDQGAAWIFSGPVFAGKLPLRTIGPDRIAVPTHTFKVILCVHRDNTKEAFAFAVPNLAKPKGAVGQFAFSVDYVEKLTGLDFFDNLPTEEQRRIESTTHVMPTH